MELRIEYWCKHCKHLIGEVNRPSWTQADAEFHCGLQELTPVERSEAVAYHGNGDVMYVQTVCDYCENGIEMHPELLVEGKLLQ
jgi:hypothetical protein